MFISSTDFFFFKFKLSLLFLKRDANSKALVRIVAIVADGVVQIFAFAAVIRTDSNASFLEAKGIFWI